MNCDNALPAGEGPLADQPAFDEVTVVSRAQDGDVASFEILVRRYQAPLFRLAYRMLADRGEAEDVVQESLVLVWRRLPTLVDPAVFRGWVYKIATRRCLAVVRSRTRHPAATVEAGQLERAQDASRPAPATASTSTGDPAAVSQRAAEWRGLEKLLQTLPEDQRACWILREMHELSYADIAYATGVPAPTVRGRIARARQSLAKGMEPWR